MILKTCHKHGITVIATVRKPEQAEYLTKELGQKFVVDTSESDYQVKLANYCKKLKPKACLESISGNTTGEMLRCLTFDSTLILYGLLSE